MRLTLTTSENRFGSHLQTEFLSDKDGTDVSHKRSFTGCYKIGDIVMQMPDIANNPGGFGASDSLNTLAQLHILSIDTRRGFEKMVKKADIDFQPTAERFSALHGRHVARLDAMVREMGGVPDSDGSFMGTVNTVVVSLRSVFDAIDMDVMDWVRSGEENVLTAFDHAIAASLPQGHREALIEMKTELTRLLHETRQLG